jgi:hypothetical protein
MIEYEDGDTEELRHKTVERYISLQQKYSNGSITMTNKIKVTSENNNTEYSKKTTMVTTTNKLPPNHAMAVLKEKTGKMLEYRHLINHKDP